MHRITCYLLAIAGLAVMIVGSVLFAILINLMSVPEARPAATTRPSAHAAVAIIPEPKPLAARPEESTAVLTAANSFQPRRRRG